MPGVALAGFGSVSGREHGRPDPEVGRVLGLLGRPGTEAPGLNNVVRHSGAASARVHLSMSGGALRLENGDGLAEAIPALRPDVVVLDITLPGTNGIALASRLTRAGSCPRIPGPAAGAHGRSRGTAVRVPSGRA